MRVLIYARVSTLNQAEEGTSLGTQLAACRAYCQEHGYQILGEYQDVMSGAVYRERPALSELRQRVRSRDVDVVVCYALDRLSRDQLHLAVMLEEIEHHGARLELVTETFDDTPVGRIVRNVLMFVAEMEREKIRERTARGKLARIQSGSLLPGRKPRYGYQWSPDHTCYLIDPETAPVVQRIFRRYVEGAALRTIIAELYADRIPPPTGPFRRWAISTVNRLLQQPAYIGEAHAWKGAIALPEGTIPPLVSRAIWERAQARLAVARERSQRNNRNPEAALLRGGIGKCGLCGGNLKAVRYAERGGQPVYSYLCSRAGDTCQQFRMRAHLLDGLVLAQLRALFVDDGLIAGEAARLAAASADDPRTGARARRAALEKQQAALGDAIALAADADAIAALVTRLETVSAQLRALADEQRALDLEAARADRQRQELHDLLAIRADVAANFDELGYAERRELLDLLQVTVYLWPSTREPRWEMASPVLVFS